MPYQKLKELSRDQFLSPTECAKLCSAPKKNKLLGIRDFAILKLFLNCGLRKQELIDLRVKDLTEDNHDWILRIHGKGSTLDELDVLNYTVVDAVKKYLSKAGHADQPDAPMFQPTVKNAKSTTNKINRLSIDYLINKYAKIAGIQKNIHAHTLRHTFGTQLFSVCKDIRIVQRAMRHRNLSSTMLYLHTARDELKNGLAQLAL